jgi:hypothetical protein
MEVEFAAAAQLQRNFSGVNDLTASRQLRYCEKAKLVSSNKCNLSKLQVYKLNFRRNENAAEQGTAG